MRRVWAIVLAAALLGLALAAAPASADLPYEASEHFFESEDGTMLHADVFVPTGADKVPVVLLVTPYRVFAAPTGRPGLAYRAEFERLLNEGYAIHQVSLRGYGESDGCGDFGGNGEQMDARAAVEWSAQQPWSSGRVGMFGISYDGWTQVMAMANEAKGLEAAVVSSPLISLYRGLYMNGVHYAQGWHTTPAAYAAIDLASVGKPTAKDPECYATNQTQTANDDPSAPYWQERDLVKKARESDVPVFWTHGFRDANTKPDNFLPVYRELDGFRRAWFGQFAHRLPSPSVGLDGFIDEVVGFYDRFLKGESGRTGADQSVKVEQGDGRWRTESQWPPRDARPHRLPLNPGSYEDLPGNDAANAGRSSNGVWTFTQPLPYDVHLAGEPSLDLRIAAERGGVYVIALVYDVAPSGQAKLITRGAFQARGEGLLSPLDEKAAFALYPQDWRLPAGHRLGVFISGSDDSWFDPGHTGSTVDVRAAGLTIPFLRHERDYIEGGPARSSSFWFQTSVAEGTVEANERRVKLPPRMR